MGLQNDACCYLVGGTIVPATALTLAMRWQIMATG